MPENQLKEIADNADMIIRKIPLPRNVSAMGRRQ